MNEFPYDAVVFDLDGTLFDAEEGIVSSVESAMEDLGLPIPADADLRQVVGPPLLDSFRNLLKVPEDKLEEAVELYKKHFADEGMYRYTVYPHIRSILQMLREGDVHVGLATSKDYRIAKRVMDYFGMSQYFNAIIGEDSAYTKLGKPELIRRALPEKYHCAAMVGDRCFDVKGAIGAGIESVGVSYGCGSEEELQDAGADHIVPDTESLRALLCPGADIPRGFFLSMEGLDGSGKTTQMELLEKKLRQLGYSVLRTREPGGCDISEDIRNIILDTDNMEMSSTTEALLYAASRAQHVHQRIRPAVEEGRVVLCDRFVDSSVAYQGGGRQLGVETIQQINAPAVADMLPDATIYLAIDHRTAIRRRLDASTPDRLELENIEFFERVQKAYERLIKENRKRFIAVDAERDIDSIAKDVLLAVLERLEPEAKWEA
ncbi:MAG: dTMP kinase [Clostridiales bacterium]|nr:dTMP kinase [Clostridiales bacterium]